MSTRMAVMVLLAAGLHGCHSSTRTCYPDEHCVKALSPPPPGCENGPRCYADVVRCHQYGDDNECPEDYSCVYTGWPCPNPYDLGAADMAGARPCAPDEACLLFIEPPSAQCHCGQGCWGIFHHCYQQGPEEMCPREYQCLSVALPCGNTKDPCCSDQIKNGTESDVDCGGGSCPGCAKGQACIRNSDCAGNLCSGGRCE